MGVLQPLLALIVGDVLDLDLGVASWFGLGGESDFLPPSWENDFPQKNNNFWAVQSSTDYLLNWFSVIAGLFFSLIRLIFHCIAISELLKKN